MCGNMSLFGIRGMALPGSDRPPTRPEGRRKEWWMVASAILPALVLQAALYLVDPSAISPEAEIVLVSVVRGVNPHVALAVAQAESGRIPEASGRRDRVVFKGNYGRFQVNCTTWKQPMGIASCRDLLKRLLNIRAGIAVLAYVQSFRRAHLQGSADWVAHYNEGSLVSAGGPGERYARRVNFLMRRYRHAAEERYRSFNGW